MKLLDELAAACGGKIETVGGPLPDGSGFAVMSLPLSKDHWIHEKDGDWSLPPPMVLRTGTAETIAINGVEMSREDFAKKIRKAGRYAVRSATMNGESMDFDPDALVQNLVVGFLGYHTADGLGDEAWMNPQQPRGGSDG